MILVLHDCHVCLIPVRTLFKVLCKPEDCLFSLCIQSISLSLLHQALEFSFQFRNQLFGLVRCQKTDLCDLCGGNCALRIDNFRRTKSSVHICEDDFRIACIFLFIYSDFNTAILQHNRNCIVKAGNGNGLIAQNILCVLNAAVYKLHSRIGCVNGCRLIDAAG